MYMYVLSQYKDCSKRIVHSFNAPLSRRRTKPYAGHNGTSYAWAWSARRCDEFRFYWRTNSCRCFNCVHSALLGQQLSAWVTNCMAHILHIVLQSLSGIFLRIPGGYMDCLHTTSCFRSLDDGERVLYMGKIHGVKKLNEEQLAVSWRMIKTET